MRRYFFILIAILSSNLYIMADEGMWRLPEMESINYQAMREMGLEIPASDIYSMRGGSIADAVVIFNGGCTGEIVSPRGLLFTNHHCGYSSLQALSTVDKDYLSDGFWAINEEGEIPAPGVDVRFTRATIDVTREIIGGVPSISSQEERESIARTNIEKLITDFENNTLFIPRVIIKMHGVTPTQRESTITNIEAIKGVEYTTHSVSGELSTIEVNLDPTLNEKRARKAYSSIEDVVSQLASKGLINDISPLYLNFKAMGNMISIKPFYGGNSYSMYIMERYNDVRLVGAPPQSIGKFGGETDNWMWPRHTGDFAIFRVYAGEDNKPASYSENNRPYQSEEYLSISTAGYNKGDYTMMLGFPGSTQRFLTSYEIDEIINISNPQRISIRGARQEILREKMDSSSVVQLQYASKYAMSSNYWKNSIGVLEAIERLDVRSKIVTQQEEFGAWAAINTLPTEGYIDALTLIQQGRGSAQGYRASLQYISEAGVIAMNITTIAHAIYRAYSDEMSEREYEELLLTLDNLYKDYHQQTEHAVSEKMVEMISQNVEHKPSIFTEFIEPRYQDNISEYVDYLFSTSRLSSLEKAKEFIESRPSLDEVTSDPAVKFSRSIYEKSAELRKEVIPFEQQVRQGKRLYIAGLLMANPSRNISPDANFSMRLTYGQVLPYSVNDTLEYHYQTTLDEVIAKEDLSNPLEFSVEQKLKDIHNSGDYGAYADKSGVMPVAFISNNDITGGNSGSPVLNSRGELIGITFDGNWEAISADLAFEEELQRAISVDIRYLLLIVNQFAGAEWLLDELTIVP